MQEQGFGSLGIVVIQLILKIYKDIITTTNKLVTTYTIHGETSRELLTIFFELNR